MGCTLAVHPTALAKPLSPTANSQQPTAALFLDIHVAEVVLAHGMMEEALDLLVQGIHVRHDVQIAEGRVIAVNLLDLVVDITALGVVLLGATLVGKVNRLITDPGSVIVV